MYYIRYIGGPNDGKYEAKSGFVLEAPSEIDGYRLVKNRHSWKNAVWCIDYRYEDESNE